MKIWNASLLATVILACTACQGANHAAPVAQDAPIVMPLRSDASGVVWLPTVGLGLIRKPDSSAFAGVIVYPADNDMTRAYQRMGADVDPALRIDPGLGAVGLRLGDRLDRTKLPAHLRVPAGAPKDGVWLVRKDGGLVTLTFRSGRITSITVYGPFILNNRLIEEHGDEAHALADGHGHNHADGTTCCDLSKLTPAPPQTDALPTRDLILNPASKEAGPKSHGDEGKPDRSVIRWPLVALLAGLLAGGGAGYYQAKKG